MSFLTESYQTRHNSLRKMRPQSSSVFNIHPPFHCSLFATTPFRRSSRFFRRSSRFFRQSAHRRSSDPLLLDALQLPSSAVGPPALPGDADVTCGLRPSSALPSVLPGDADQELLPEIVDSTKMEAKLGEENGLELDVVSSTVSDLFDLPVEVIGNILSRLGTACEVVIEMARSLAHPPPHTFPSTQTTGLFTTGLQSLSEAKIHKVESKLKWNEKNADVGHKKLSKEALWLTKKQPRANKREKKHGGLRVLE